MMLDVARQGGEDRPVSLAGVSDRSRISHKYLEQLTPSLRNARLLRGVCGKGGGYQLARPASEISIREIIEAVDGPVNVVECVEHPEDCIRSDFCECRPMYLLINRRITEALGAFTLADLLNPATVQQLRLGAGSPRAGGARLRRDNGVRPPRARAGVRREKSPPVAGEAADGRRGNGRAQAGGEGHSSGPRRHH